MPSHCKENFWIDSAARSFSPLDNVLELIAVMIERVDPSVSSTTNDEQKSPPSVLDGGRNVTSRPYLSLKDDDP